VQRSDEILRVRIFRRLFPPALFSGPEPALPPSPKDCSFGTDHSASFSPLRFVFFSSPSAELTGPLFGSAFLSPQLNRNSFSVLGRDDASFFLREVPIPSYGIHYLLFFRPVRFPSFSSKVRLLFFSCGFSVSQRSPLVRPALVFALLWRTFFSLCLTRVSWQDFPFPVL